jgi:uncharacterized protein YkwD
MRYLAVFLTLFLFFSKNSIAESCEYCIPSSYITCNEIKEALDEVNKIRAEVGSPPLKWDCKLAEESQKWAEYLARNKKFIHSKAKNYGENLFMGIRFTMNLLSGEKEVQVYSLSEAIKNWYSEKKYYVHGKSDWCMEGKVCGHYTQLVWKNTKYIGCGKAVSGVKTYIVCRFYPAGNIIGEQPY